MIDRTLGALQVAALLVSASYGIGFLFGSGEYALQIGMGGAIYGIATGIGMLALAVFAGRLWHARRNVWDLFGDRFGGGVGRLVALLSIVWMSGVLAAQIHGATAVLRLLDVPTTWAAAGAVGLILGASRFRLQWASGVFSACLAGSAVVLVYALLRADGMEIYRRAVPAFVDALPSIGLVKSLAIAVGVGLLVCTGADYHQFILAARDRASAIAGTALAGFALLTLAFLPPAVVIASVASSSWSGAMDAKQAVPQALAIAARDFSQFGGAVMLAMLGLAALGSGAAILRAMVSALEAAQTGIASLRPLTLALLALGAATALTLSGLPIVDTMVSVNVVYIASVGVSLAALLRPSSAVVGPREAWVIGAGFVGSLAGYLLAGITVSTGGGELAALAAGLLSATVVRLALGHRRRRDLACRPSDG
jgi:SSS family solute:Na+ symporter